MGAHLVMRKIEMVTPPSMLLLWMGAHLVMRKIEMVTHPLQVVAMDGRPPGDEEGSTMPPYQAPPALIVN